MHKRVTVLLATSLIAGSLLSGCATTPTGIQTSALGSGPEIPLTQSAPIGTVLAVIRYPAFVESDDEEIFAERFASTAIGGRNTNTDIIQTQSLANSVLLKSNYFAMSLYRELAARLPEHSVLLSPHRIYVGDDGALTSEPMTQAESVASVVTVDFTAYSFPDLEDMMGSKPLTFGDLVTPLVTIRTDPRTSVGSEGILLASSPVIGAAAGGSYAQAIDDARALQSGRLEAGPPELDLISYISGKPRLAPRTSELRRQSAATVGRYPMEKIQLNRDEIKRIGEETKDVLEAPFTDAFANQVMRAINRTDARKAVMLRRADVIADYDQSLAALSLVGSDAPDYLTRIRYAERLLEAEQKYLSVQSLRLYDGIFNGEMGEQVRDMLQEEHFILEQRRKLARQQNIATAAAFAAIIGGVAIASQDDGPSSFGDQLATQALIQGALFSVSEAIRRNRLSQAVGQNYLESVVPTLSDQTEIQLDLIDSNETITAIRFEDLKEKLSELYSESQRSLDIVATRCAYEAPTGSGTWLGVCENGLANGSGVGVFRNEAGDLVEHYGFARMGLADGPGYRIIRTPNGSQSIEGNFANGRPNGAARVERSGSVALRLFKAGQDMGNAPAGTVIASPFAQRNPAVGLQTG